ARNLEREGVAIQLPVVDLQSGDIAPDGQADVGQLFGSGRTTRDRRDWTLADRVWRVDFGARIGVRLAQRGRTQLFGEAAVQMFVEGLLHRCGAARDDDEQDHGVKEYVDAGVVHGL